MTTLPNFAHLGSYVFRDYVVDGVPGSGNQPPAKADSRAWAATIEQTLNALISRAALIGGSFVASAAANVLTVAIKTNAGNDPSATEPVYADFRNTTPGSGLPHLLPIVAALSFTGSAGSTFGMTNAVNGRLWLVLFYDAGVPRLGVFNAYGGSGIIYPLGSSQVASSTAEGGAGAADSAGVFYTGAAVAAKPFIVLGHMTWETALATAGLYTAAPDVVHQQRLGNRLPGDLVQRQAAISGAVASNNTVLPFDNTVPQNTEGFQFQTASITPSSKANVLEVEHNGNYAGSVAGHVTAALFQDAVAGALAARAGKVNTANDVLGLSLLYRAIAATNAATTFNVRAGLSTAGTVTFNGANALGLFNGVDLSLLELVERVA